MLNLVVMSNLDTQQLANFVFWPWACLIRSLISDPDQVDSKIKLLPQFRHVCNSTMLCQSYRNHTVDLSSGLLLFRWMAPQPGKIQSGQHDHNQGRVSATHLITK